MRNERGAYALNMTDDEYRRYTETHMPRSPVGKHVLGAFLIGGLICCLGQMFFDLYRGFGLEEQAAGTAESVTLVFLGAVLTGFGVYDDIARYAGAGTLVPITGFANSIAAPALEFKTEGLVTGMAAKMFVIAGPVLVFGLSSSVVYGLILLLFGLV
ncbi:MAG: stage V sporulation protein AC [Oscillospiraceae bacterium]|nr:stage V sporulation protein AC [Oscillospiraceae bacterium]